jgi:hypothetical protein
MRRLSKQVTLLLQKGRRDLLSLLAVFDNISRADANDR